jgi:site-specific recombinase XerD
MPKRTRFSQALYDFDAFLETQKNLSPRTRQAYRYDIDRFVDFWLQRHGKDVTLDAVSLEDVKFYLEHLRMDLHYRSTTLSRVIASIRIFFEFCVVEGLLESSPAAHLHNPKNPRRLPIFLIESELKRLFQAPTLDEEAQEEGRSKIYPHLVKRDYAILVTLGLPVCV